MPPIRTPRLLLVPATPTMLRAELASRPALAHAVDAEVPASWPPEFYDADAIRWTLAWQRAHPNDGAWGLYYVARRPVEASALPCLVGVGGYKDGPDPDGVVELGYGIVAESRRRGFAREAVDGLLAHAFADPRVTCVIAHTLPTLAPSIAVLHSAGFALAGAGIDSDEPSAIRYALPRTEYDRTREGRATVEIAR